MDEEEEVCRVCRSAEEPGHALFHPCKCKGSIRYVHQDCLMTWLQSSRRKYCELCGYPFAFTKVYDPRMPSTLPPLVLLTRILKQLAYSLLFVLRVITVGVTWLGLVPWCTIWATRLHFFVGHGISRSLTGGSFLEPLSLANGTLTNGTSPLTNTTFPSPSHPTLPSLHPLNMILLLHPTTSALLDKPSFSTLLSDIFEGQIITASVVVLFLVAFLMKEWVLQIGEQPEGAIAPDGPDAIRDQDQIREVARRAAEMEMERRLRARQDEDRVIRFLRRVEEGDELAIEVEEEKEKSDDDDESDSGEEKKEAYKRPSPEEIRRIREAFIDSLDSDRAPLPADEPELIPSWDPPSPARSSGPSLPLHLPSDPTPLTLPTPLAEPALSEEDPIFSLDSIRTFSHSLESPHPEPSTSATLGSAGRPEETEIELGTRPDSFVWDGAKFPVDSDVEADETQEDFRRNQASLEEPEDRYRPLTESIPVEDNEENEENWVDEDEEDVIEVRVEVPRLAALLRNEEMDEEELDQARQGIHEAADQMLRQLQDNEDAQEEMMDDLEGPNDRLLDEDMEGLMEAVGLRGPFMALVQNSALITILLSFFIGVAVFIPFTTGRTFLLLNFLSIYRSLLYPVRLVRVLTDPFVKSILAFSSKRIAPYTDHAVSPLLLSVSSWRSGSQSGPTTLQTLGSKLSTWSLSPALDSTLQAIIASPAEGSEPQSTSIRLARPFVRKALSMFGKLGSNYRAIYTAGRTFVSSLPERQTLGFASLAEGDELGDRMFAIAVGYGCIVLGLIAFLRSQNTSNGWQRYVKDALMQNIVVLKLGFFMAIELIVFPLGCGILLDFCLLPLFPRGVFWSRIEFQLNAMFISTFLHWVGGTLFMFGFASMLSYCRTKVRKGVFYFVRDPSDPAFQPVREIIDRPTSSQLAKLGISALMYGFIISSSVGLVLGMIRILTRGVLPLRWMPTEPLSQIPVDLLLMLICIPSVVRYLAPQRPITAVLFTWWTSGIKALRLQSYFFGPPITLIGADVEDQKDTTERVWLDAIAVRMGGKDFQKGTGGLARVPHSDQLSIIPRTRMLVLLNEFHAPIDQNEMELLIAQNKKAVSAGRRPDQDFCVCYIPPRLRNRIFLLTFSFWLSLVATAGFSLALPISIGRLVFRLFGCPIVHDGYSLLLGAFPSYFIFRALTWAIGFALAKKTPRNSLARQFGRFKRPLSRKTLWISVFNKVYVAATIGSIVPLAVGLVVELYCILPFRSPLSEPSVVRLSEVWAMGVLWVYIAFHLRGYCPATYRPLIFGPLERLPQLTAKKATTKVVLPVLAGSSILIGGPFLLALTLSPYVNNPALLFRGMYLAVLLSGLSFASAQDARRLVNKWGTILREREYLVDLRLRNIDDRTDRRVVAEDEVEADRRVPPELAAVL